MHMRTRGMLCAIGLVGLVIACGNLRSASRTAAPARTVAPPRQAGLYGADEALRDVLSGNLTHVGTGTWPGSNRTYACAFRNARVIVVNVYCGQRDTQAFRLEVYSPTRGRARIYAESKAPVSARAQDEYFTFTVESEPPGSAARVPPVHLRMSFAELQAYELKRYEAYLPSCYGGKERNQPKHGCLGPLAPEASAWMRQNGDFLAHASEPWYRVVRALRVLAAHHGKDPS